MTSNSFGIRALRRGLLVLFLSCVTNPQTSSGQIRSVAISPDSKLVAASFEKEGNKAFIYRVAVETGVAIRLTAAKDGEESSPASPDGERIAYTYWPGNHKRPRIVIVNIDGTDSREWSPTRVSDSTPVFSPDGKTIVFMAASDGKHGYDYDVYRLDLQTGSWERLTKGNGYATNLTVSMNGKTAVFLKWRSDRHATLVGSEVYLLDLETRKLISLSITGLD